MPASASKPSSSPGRVLVDSLDVHLGGDAPRAEAGEAADCVPQAEQPELHREGRGVREKGGRERGRDEIRGCDDQGRGVGSEDEEEPRWQEVGGSCRNLAKPADDADVDGPRKEGSIFNKKNKYEGLNEKYMPQQRIISAKKDATWVVWTCSAPLNKFRCSKVHFQSP